MNDNKQKNKHLSYDDRKEIETGLRENKTFKDIAAIIGKDPSTISKEVKKHIFVTNALNPDSPPCDQLIRPPYVCNGCSKRNRCRLERHRYQARTAHDEYRETLVDSRTGVALNKEAFYRADEILYDGVVNKGQNIYHIASTHNLGMSKSTVYRNIDKGYLSIGKMDLPRAVKFKPRKKNKNSDYVPPVIKAGRTYDDFLAYIEENEVENWVEMDTVIGSEGGKVIMTFDFTGMNFMPALLLDNKTAAEASAKVIALKNHLKENGLSFGEIFEILLTDNGGEFANVCAFTDDTDGNTETQLFFCEPYKSCQKPRVEKNHTLFRSICPKGTSFDNFTQEDVNFIFSHVNSVKRKKLHQKTPYEMFAFTYGEKVADMLGIKPINAEEVCQSPILLKKLPSLSK